MPPCSLALLRLPKDQVLGATDRAEPALAGHRFRDKPAHEGCGRHGRVSLPWTDRSNARVRSGERRSGGLCHRPFPLTALCAYSAPANDES
jgi:hypothetical protein